MNSRISSPAARTRPKGSGQLPGKLRGVDLPATVAPGGAQTKIDPKRNSRSALCNERGAAMRALTAWKAREMELKKELRIITQAKEATRKRIADLDYIGTLVTELDDPTASIPMLKRKKPRRRQ